MSDVELRIAAVLLLQLPGVEVRNFQADVHGSSVSAGEVEKPNEVEKTAEVGKQ